MQIFKIFPKIYLNNINLSLSLSLSLSHTHFAVLPIEPLTIRGSAAETRLDVGDHLNVTCVSGASRPPQQLTWTINDQPVSYFSPLTPTSLHHSESKLESSTNLSKDYRRRKAVHVCLTLMRALSS